MTTPSDTAATLAAAIEALATKAQVGSREEAHLMVELAADLVSLGEDAYVQGMRALMAAAFAGAGPIAADHEWQERALLLMQRLLMCRRLAELIGRSVAARNLCPLRSAPPTAA